MFKVGLSGNLYSGYEDVAAQFKKIGIPVFDADLVSKFMIHYDAEILKEIRIKIGDSSFKNGFLNENAFNSTIKLNLILDIIHKRLLESWERFRLKNKKSTYTIFKYSLLFERGFDGNMNFNINTFTPKDDRILRLKKSEHLSFMDAYALIDNGPDDIDKNKLSTYVIHNYDEAKVNIEMQVKNIDKILREKVETQGISSIFKNVFN